MEDQKVVVEQVIVSKPQGKGLAVTGFVLALVTLVFNNVVFLAALASIGLGGSGWLMYFWLVLNIASVVLSVAGMVKLKRTGGKRGLGIAGMVIGIVGTVWAIILTLGVAYGDSQSAEIHNRVEMELNQMGH